MDSGDEFDRHDDADEPDDLDALDADDLPSADDESASPDQGDEDRSAADGPERGIKAKCARCGETARVLAPKGTRFVTAEDEAETEAVIKSPKLKWTCTACETDNFLRPKTYKLKKTDEAAAAFFASRYRPADVDDDDGDPRDDAAVKFFRESYDAKTDADDWRRACAQYR